MGKQKGEAEFDISGIVNFLKENWNWLILVAILVLAFNLRLYHADYPVVGYHNWKEAHYLTEARNYAEDGFFKYGLFVPANDFPHLGYTENDMNTHPEGAHPDTFPTISIIIGFFFKIFGPSLKVARLVNIFFMLGAIFFLYLVMKKLFKREDLALVTTLIAAINPLFVFFGRQVQLINPALFFMISSVYFFLLWREQPKMKYIILFALLLSLSILTKYSFAVIALPMLAIFPYERIFNKKNFMKFLKQYVVGVALLMLTPLWWIYTKILSSRLNAPAADVQIRFGTTFTSQFWDILKSYAADNYGMAQKILWLENVQIGLIFALLGLLLMVFFFFKNKDHVGYRFVMAYLGASILWFFVMSYKLSGHNYHQYPIAPLIVILISYFFVVVAANVKKMVNVKYVNIIVFLAIISAFFFPLYSASIQAKDRMFDTQFPGLDVAGEYIKTNSLPNSRMLFPSHQSYGVLWHSDRKGYPAMPSTSEEIEFAINEKNVEWIFIYQWGMSIMNEPSWEYISNNFELKQIAFEQVQGQNQPIYFLLRHGGTFNISNLNNMLANKQPTQRSYELTRGTRTLYYINI
jgi:4-amino-4-deoxy-L-arabinose transferase-like glycosyltransferase